MVIDRKGREELEKQAVQLVEMSEHVLHCEEQLEQIPLFITRGYGQDVTH